ncbi:NADP-dependent oxidoreductase [Arsenicicoccus piscis]|uniref:NADPH:quinone reductase n=1 Tax=Arsenicicoccus piscis TaxID=673954 RepID=A0ABQ6HKS8_9MICO|nr:NADP-dependent oxidoreductase [Arsenicicoccus piscis]MCH8627051.1 NADP-dependent oxidoreductase [Arsenicicoccus piscis]GMA19015.1 NADPH:quinone reductase [Arsenicicoccus piscis]
MRLYGFDRYGGAQVQRFFDVPDPTPGPGQVVVRLAAAGINPADIKVRDGARQGTVPVQLPMAMGREAAGVVESAGSATELVEGELVFGSTAAGFGALSELVVLDTAQTAPVPDGVSVEQAACLPVASGTAWDALHELALRPGSTLLVLGAGGGVGTSATQLGRHLGLRVVGVAGPAKQQLVEGMGAVHVRSGDGFVDRVRAAAPDGVDAIIDAVGGSVLADAATLLRVPGAIRSAAAPALAAELGGAGVTRRRSSAVYAEVAALVADGVLAPIIAATYGFDEAADAVAAVETGHATGKTVVRGPRPSPEPR